MGLGVNNRMRRGEFLRNVLKKAVIVASPNGYRAKIDNPDIMFSKGKVALTVVFQAITAGANAVSVSLLGAGTEQIDPAIYDSSLTRLVAMVYDSHTQELTEVITRIANKPIQGSTVATPLIVSHPSGYFVDVYAIPMSTADGSSVSVDTSYVTKDDAAIAAMLSLNKNAVVFEYGKSQLIGSATYTPA